MDETTGNAAPAEAPGTGPTIEDRLAQLEEWVKDAPKNITEVIASEVSKQTGYLSAGPSSDEWARYKAKLNEAGIRVEEPGNGETQTGG